MPIETLEKELRFGTKNHNDLVQQLRERRKFAEDKIRDRHHDRWIQADENMRGYIPLSEADKQRRANRRYGPSSPDYVTLVVPYPFAIISSMHTYLSSVFLSRAPVYQFTGRHGETQDAIQAVEAVMDYQLRVGKQLVPLYNWIYDSCKYGLGVVGEYWEVDNKIVSRYEEVESTILGIGTGNFKKKRLIERIPAYEGNKIYNIRPYDFLPDPRVTVAEFQKGEFCGRKIQVGLSQLLQQHETGRYFNLDKLQDTQGNRDFLRDTGAEGFSTTDSELDAGSTVVDTPYGVQGATYQAAPGKGFVQLLEMCVRIQPRKWKLGKNNDPEIWMFTLANNRVLIGARPLALYHDRFPYSILETGFGSEDFIKQGTLDQIRPLSEALTWLFNSHMYNVRKVINDRIVVDPSKVVMRDIEKPNNYGGYIRLRPEAVGTDTRTVASQLQVADVTQNHMRDSQVIEQLMQRTSGVVDNIMGLVNTGGRKTATESRIASSFSINRMKTFAEYFSAGGFGDLAERQLSNTQQLLTLDRKFAIAGNNMQNAQRFAEVNPEAIAGFYDFVQVDGTLPVDRLAQANFWKELLGQLARIPQLAAQWDFGEMISHVMMLQGEKNTDRFRIQVADPGANLQSGNVVPIGEASGQSAGGGANPAGGSTGGTI